MVEAAGCTLLHAKAARRDTGRNGASRRQPAVAPSTGAQLRNCLQKIRIIPKSKNQKSKIKNMVETFVARRVMI
jgi:hypothetical protein